MAEIDYLQIKLLKETNKLAKIPTSAIVEEEARERRPLYSDYMREWPEVHSYLGVGVINKEGRKAGCTSK